MRGSKDLLLFDIYIVYDVKSTGKHQKALDMSEGGVKFASSRIVRSLNSKLPFLSPF